MSLKTRLASIPTAARVHEVDAPELGPGEKVHVRRFTIGERLKFSEEFDSVRAKTADGKFAVPVDEQYKRLLPLVAVEPDGTRSFSGAADEALNQVPAALAERMILAATEASTVAASEAKKPSPVATRNSSN